jgi:hypothetical protein
MTERAPQRRNNLLFALVAAGISALTLACGPSYFEIPIETPIQPKLDVSAFQRVLIAGFVAGGTDDVDANQETVRLLRSQLRSKSSLRVIDADVMPLVEIAQEQSKASGAAGTATGGAATDGDGTPARESGATAAPIANVDRSNQPLPLPDRIKDEKISSRTSGCSPIPPTGSASAKSSRIR